MTEMFACWARPEAMGSKGRLAPGDQVSPTMRRKSFQVMASMGVAVASVLGSAVKTLAMLERLTTRGAPKRSASQTASKSVEKPGFQPAATRTEPAKAKSAEGSVTTGSAQRSPKTVFTNWAFRRVAAMPIQSSSSWLGASAARIWRQAFW